VRRLDLPDIFSGPQGRRQDRGGHPFLLVEFFNRAPFDLVRDIEYDEPEGPINHGRFHTMTGYNLINQMTPSDMTCSAR
jgi:hypothetical protein